MHSVGLLLIAKPALRLSPRVSGELPAFLSRSGGLFACPTASKLLPAEKTEPQLEEFPHVSIPEPSFNSLL